MVEDNSTTEQEVLDQIVLNMVEFLQRFSSIYRGHYA
jgi:hypothetical protein